MSQWTLVYEAPIGAVELIQHVDPFSGRLHEAFLWDCACGARGQLATLEDAKGELIRHRALTHAGHQVDVFEAIAEAETS